ncbi:MAG: hypothetical protein AABX96_02035 [Nanoarchaeota archaeon]
MSSHLGDSESEPLKVRKGLISWVFDNSIWVGSLILLSLYFLSPSPIDRVCKEDRRMTEIFERVRGIANTDRCDGTSYNEWKNVYESLGLENTDMMGRDISYGDLQRYISMSESVLSRR